MVKYIYLHILIFSLFVLKPSLKSQINKVEEVTKLNDAINSSAEEIMPLLSYGGDSLFFARIFHEDNQGGFYSGSDIWLSVYNKELGEWSAATNKIKKWNNKLDNFIVGMNQKEKLFYMNHSKKPEKGLNSFKVAYGISFKPETINLPGIPNTGYQGMYVSPDEKAIILSMKAKDSFGEEDLYVVLKNEEGQWEQPLNLGVSINTPASEISPFLAPDQRRLYFASKGHGGFGDMDIFMSERLYNSWTVWSNPVNMGDKINSSSFDGYYSQYSDTVAFFSSNREAELSDLYQVRFSKTKAQKVRVMQVTNAETVNKRNYLEQIELKNLLGFNKIPSIEIKSNDRITDNKMAQELLYFLADKFQDNSELKMGIKVVVLQMMSTEKMVVEASKIASFIASEMQKNGVSFERVLYDGVTAQNQNAVHEFAFQVRLSFFK